VTRRRRVLAVVGRFKSSHIDYLHALAHHTELSVAWSAVGRPGSPQMAMDEGLRLTDLGDLADTPADVVRARLAQAIADADPEVVHVMYYRHEQLAVWVREIVGSRAIVVLEVRDPRTTLDGAGPGSPAWQLEAAALRASDGQIGVSDALLRYLERAHGRDLSDTSLVVPHAFARRNAGEPQPKLSATDGRIHLALVGTASPDPGHGRYYVDIIRSLVDQGLIVHSRFHRIAGVSLAPYEQLAAELPGRYLHEDKLPYRDGTLLSAATSRYDLMGVFHQLDAPLNNESATLAICMPTKAVSGWFHGAIPIVCFPHYGGLVEQVQAKGIGFVVENLADVGALAADPAAITRATQNCLAVRDQFSHEYQAARIAAFYEGLSSASMARFAS
jgi:hypothetical protein